MSPNVGTDTKDQSETLETLMNGDARLRRIRVLEEPTPELSVGAVNHARIRVSAVLMQLISCGSIPVNRPRTRRHSRTFSVGSVNGVGSVSGDLRAMPTGFRLEEMEYFSGSLIETQKERGIESDVPQLKRSSSYNADRLVPTEEGVAAVRAKCIPGRKPTRDRGCRKVEAGKRTTDETAKQAAE